MRIHQVTHLFHPDALAGASLYTDLARYFRDRGHDVRVTSTFSYYPQLQFRPEHRSVLRQQEIFEGIPLRRVGMWLPRRHKGAWRLGPEVSFLAGLTVAGRFTAWRPDVVFVACPMLAQAMWQRWAYAGQGIPRLLVVQDLMAAAATELGIVKSRGLGALLTRAERWTLQGASRICTISDGMRERINAITGGTPPCTVVPNWIHKGLADAVARRKEQVAKRPEPTLFYSGNFGVKQGLPGFLEHFRTNRGEWRLRLNGGGAEAEALGRAVEGWGDWIQVGGLLDEEDYVRRLLEATACLITQQKGVGANFLPSKLLPALTAGLPVLAICERSSPLAREVIEGGFGEVVAPGDDRALAAVLNEWRHSPGVLQQLSDKAVQRAARYSRASVCRTYESLLEELVERSRVRRGDNQR